MVHCSPRFAAAALAVAVGAGTVGAGCAGGDGAAPPTTAASVDQAEGTAPVAPDGPGTGLPDTSLPGGDGLPGDGGEDPGSGVPPASRRAVELAGADAQEAACIAAGMAAADRTGEDVTAHADAHVGAAGTVVVACLPPAKLAAALAERLRSPVLGLALDESRLSCARAALAADAGSPAYTTLVGGLALEDGVAVREGGRALDAVCGTDLADPVAS